MNSTALIDRLRFWLTAGIALLLPLNFLAVSIVGGALLLLTILRWTKNGGFRKPDRLPLLFFIGFYMMHSVAMLYTEHRDEGLFNQQVKAGLLLFPVIFAFTAPLEARQVRTVLLAFIAGTCIAALLCLSLAVYDYNETGNPEELFYTALSFYVHPSYMAMYAVMAALALLHLEPFAGGIKRVLLIQAALLFLLFFIVMLQSKMGLIAALVFIPAAFLLQAWRDRKWKIPVLALAALALGYWATDKFIVTNANSRIYNATYNITHAQPVVTNSAETSEVRMNIWRTVKEILPQYWLTGAGTGDAKYVLLENYEKRGMTYAAGHKLNAHNQFLQTWLMTGIAGVLLLLLSLAWPLAQSLRRRRSLYVFFLLLFGMNILAEAMLEVQAGTIFYGFFNAFFCFAAAGWRETSIEKI